MVLRLREPVANLLDFALERTGEGVGGGEWPGRLAGVGYILDWEMYGNGTSPLNRRLPRDGPKDRQFPSSVLAPMPFP